MLVLSRQRDEVIMIGDDVEITIVDIRGEKVRLGINAPPHIPVHRKEVYDAIKREKAGLAGEDGRVPSLAKRHKPPPTPQQAEPPPEAKPTPETEPPPEAKPTPETEPPPEAKPTPETEPPPEAKPTPETEPPPEAKD